MRRICVPIGVPPGSTDRRMLWPAAISRSASSWSWVLLPLPSGPSKVMNSPRAPARSWSVVDKVQDFLEIFPGFLFRLLIIGAQQVRRMERDDERTAVPFVPAPAQARHTVLGSE